MENIKIKFPSEIKTNITPGTSSPYTIEVVVDSYEQVSDGYHTIEELYDHRITLYISLCRMVKKNTRLPVWRSGKHSDGTHYDGWFMLAIGSRPGEQITYHIPISRWNETEFAETYEQAPAEFDGHTSKDVLERLKKL